MSPFAVCALGLSILVVTINLHYSLLAMLIHRLREGCWPTLLPLGIPLLGAFAIFAAWWSLPPSHAAHSLLLVLLLLDSGGPLAWLIALLQRRRRRGRTPAARLARREGH